jgi:hypothetical protein
MLFKFSVPAGTRGVRGGRFPSGAPDSRLCDSSRRTAKLLFGKRKGAVAVWQQPRLRRSRYRPLKRPFAAGSKAKQLVYASVRDWLRIGIRGRHRRHRLPHSSNLEQRLARVYVLLPTALSRTYADVEQGRVEGLERLFALLISLIDDGRQLHECLLVTLERRYHARLGCGAIARRWAETTPVKVELGPQRV